MEVHIQPQCTVRELHYRDLARSLEQSLLAPALPAADRARLLELFRDVDDVSGH